MLANGSAIAFGMDNFNGSAPTAAAVVPGGHVFNVLSSAGYLNCGIERAGGASGGALLCWGSAHLVTRNESSQFEQACGRPKGSRCGGVACLCACACALVFQSRFVC